LGKPEALTAVAIVTKEHWNLFIPFDKTARMPAGSPCGKEAFPHLRLSLTPLDSGGVEDFQQDYAFTAWSSCASRLKVHIPHLILGSITLQLRLMGTSVVYWSIL